MAGWVADSQIRSTHHRCVTKSHNFVENTSSEGVSCVLPKNQTKKAACKRQSLN